MAIYLFLILINGLFLVAKRGRTIGGFISMLMLGVIAGQTNLKNNRDAWNYMLDYQNMAQPGFVSRFEWAYVDFAKVAQWVGMDYPTFRYALFLLLFALLALSFRAFTQNLSAMFLAVALFNFPIEATQVRNFGMFVFFMVGLACLTKKTRLMKGLALFAGIISAGFHSTGYFFFGVLALAIVLPDQWLSRSVKYLWSGAIFATMLLPILGGELLGRILGAVLGFVSNNQAAAENVAGRFNNDSSAPFILALSLVFGVLAYTAKQLEFKGTQATHRAILLNFSVAMTSFGMPLLAISGQYQRILRYGVILILLKLVASYAGASSEAIRQQYADQSIYRTVATIGAFVGVFLMAIILFYGMYSNMVFANTVPGLISWPM